MLPEGCFVARQARQARQVCFLDPVLPEGHFVARQAWVIGLELQNKRFPAQIGGIKDNDAREGFFFCSSKNLNSRQKPKKNIVQGCFCRDWDTIFVSVGTGDPSWHGTVTIVRKSLKEPERNITKPMSQKEIERDRRKRRKRKKRQEKAGSNYEERTSGRNDFKLEIDNLRL